MRILSRLGIASCSVGDLARDVGMEQSAVSHTEHLRLGLAAVPRSGAVLP
ncbi:MAG: ArsR family transcriptional regulator [Solirubrobacteraceae bacterium]